MKIGASLTTSYSRALDARSIGRMIVERAAAVRAAGLDSLLLGDHHATPAPYFQNVPTLGRLLAEAGTMTVGALFLAPLYQPVLLAEQIGTLAALAEGPFVVIMAAGDGEEQFAPFGVSLKNRPSRLEEHLTIVQRLLAGEALSFAGRYHTLNNVTISPLPPEPVAYWIASSGRPALERAGRMADGWVAAPGASGEELSTQAAIYRDAAGKAGRQPHLVVRRDIYVGESDAEAEETTAPLLARGHRGFRREALIIGGPHTVADEIRYLEGLGFEHLLVRHIVSDQAQVLASYRRLGSQVLPLLSAT